MNGREERQKGERVKKELVDDEWREERQKGGERDLIGTGSRNLTVIPA